MKTIVIKNDSWMPDWLAAQFVSEHLYDGKYPKVIKGTFKDYVKEHTGAELVFRYEDQTITYEFRKGGENEKQDH